MTSSVKLSPSPVSAAFYGIKWESFGKHRLSDSEKIILRSGEDNPTEYTLSNIDEASTYIRILLKVLSEVSGPKGPSSKVSHLRDPLPAAGALQILHADLDGVVMHYVVFKLYEIICCLRGNKDGAVVSMVTIFYEFGNLIDEWRPLLRVLHLGGSGDEYAQRGSALSLAYILLAGCPSQAKSKENTFKTNYLTVEDPLKALISWTTSQLQSSCGKSLSMVTPTLTALLSSTEARTIFASEGGIGYLSRHLRVKQTINDVKGKSKGGGVSIQQIYELCFCLWIMSYDCDTSAAIRKLFARDGAIKSLVELVSSAPREKVVRVALSTLRNLALCSTNVNPGLDGRTVVDSYVFLGDMIGFGLMKVIKFMMERQWSDPDIVEDITLLNRLLHANYKEISRWDMYQAEVESGNLEWGVLHTEKFFKENCRLLEGKNDDFYLLKILINLLRSKDEDIAAIACYDIGEFVRFYPNGKSIAIRLGAKAIVITLIEHDNLDLQRHALQCISKIMVQNWEYVNN